MNNLGRRTVLGMIAAASATLITGPARAALTVASAKQLISQVVSDINSVINSGRSESRILKDFEKIFEKYGDVPIIARSTLGPDARRASPAQLAAFSDAFATYLAHKYGRRFREFQGGEIEVIDAKQVKRYFEVDSVARLRGQAPFSVVFRVSDRSGRNLFFDIVIEGISLGKTERTEIGAMLDRRRGDIDAMIADLRAVG